MKFAIDAVNRTMTTATKLTLGFGLLIVMLVLTNATIMLPLRSIDDEIRSMAEVARPLSTETKALEINVLGFALAVRTFAQTGDPQFQEDANSQIVELERHLTEYERLAMTERQHGMAQDFSQRWQKLKEQGLAIVNGGTRFYGEDEWRQIADSRIEVLRFLKDEMQGDAANDYEARKMLAIQKVSAIERFVLIFFILCVIIAIVTSVAVGRGIMLSEKELHNRRELLRATLASIGDAVVTTDIDGRVTSINAVAESLTGWKYSEALGQPLDTVFSIVDDITGNKAESPALKALRTGSIIGGSDSILLISRDGTEYPIDDRAAPILDKRGETVGSVIVFHDITEKKLHEKELQRNNDELEIRVKERTVALAQTNSALVREMEERGVAEKERIDLLNRIVSSQELERRRIARDLHDQLGQRLTALRLKIASLKDASADYLELVPRVERLQEIARLLDSEVSYLAWELRPSALDDLGLVDAIGAFVQEWSRHSETPTDFHSARIPKRRLNSEIETHLYRITQEALNNIAKHAQANHVSVMLEKRDSRVILIIEDDGRGFEPEEVSIPHKSGRGLGLLGMRERATLIGGEVEIESAPGSGTTIYVRIPVSI